MRQEWTRLTSSESVIAKKKDLLQHAIYTRTLRPTTLALQVHSAFLPVELSTIRQLSARQRRKHVLLVLGEIKVVSALAVDLVVLMQLAPAGRRRRRRRRHLDLVVVALVELIRDDAADDGAGDDDNRDAHAQDDGGVSLIAPLPLSPKIELNNSCLMAGAASDPLRKTK